MNKNDFIPYDREAWHAARLLVENHGGPAAIATAQQMFLELALQDHQASCFWRQILEIVEDWHRPSPCEGECVH